MKTFLFLVSFLCSLSFALGHKGGDVPSSSNAVGMMSEISPIEEVEEEAMRDAPSPNCCICPDSKQVGLFLPNADMPSVLSVSMQTEISEHVAENCADYKSIERQCPVCSRKSESDSEYRFRKSLEEHVIVVGDSEAGSVVDTDNRAERGRSAIPVDVSRSRSKSPASLHARTGGLRNDESWYDPNAPDEGRRTKMTHQERTMLICCVGGICGVLALIPIVVIASVIGLPPETRY